MSDLGWIVISNWDHFQHYRDRNPPWIKNYTELLHDENYLGLTGDQRSILHGLWLEYASSRCRLRADTSSLSRRLALRVTTAQLKALNHAGFIEFDASGVIAPRARARTRSQEAEEETETEEPTTKGSIAKEALHDVRPLDHKTRINGSDDEHHITQEEIANLYQPKEIPW